MWLQVREYGMSALCSSHRRLASSDLQHLLQLDDNHWLDQLKSMVEHLASRYAVPVKSGAEHIFLQGAFLGVCFASKTDAPVAQLH